MDLACNDFKIPQAISGKGAGAERLLEEAQMSLPGLGTISSPSTDSDVDTGLWHLCVSVQNWNDVRAELSLSTGINGGNFAGFRERIFIVRSGDWEALRIVRSDSDIVADVEPEVRRKKRD